MKTIRKTIFIRCLYDIETPLKTLNTFPVAQKLNKDLRQRQKLHRTSDLVSLINSANNIHPEIGYYFASLQDNFGQFIVNEEEASYLSDINSPPKEFERANPGPNAYMNSDLTQANELFKSRIFVRFKDFDIKSNIQAFENDEINKDDWQEFLRLFSIWKLL